MRTAPNGAVVLPSHNRVLTTYFPILRRPCLALAWLQTATLRPPEYLLAERQTDENMHFSRGPAAWLGASEGWIRMPGTQEHRAIEAAMYEAYC
ncbi:hypothetical protein PSPO01_10162 [Paraphaeosphaeria sporulosa]